MPSSAIITIAARAEDKNQAGGKAIQEAESLWPGVDFRAMINR